MDWIMVDEYFYLFWKIFMVQNLINIFRYIPWLFSIIDYNSNNWR